MEGVPVAGAVETNPPSIHEDASSIPGLDRWVNDLALLRAVVWLGSCVAISMA